jgi:hypothetical protein
LSEDSATVGTNFNRLNKLTVTHFFGSWSTLQYQKKEKGEKKNIQHVSISYRPKKSGGGHTILVKAVAPMTLQRRRISNLDKTLTTMILKRLKKWSASSPTPLPETITLTPASAISLTICDEKGISNW